jgi:hypothetical protein
VTAVSGDIGENGKNDGVGIAASGTDWQSRWRRQAVLIEREDVVVEKGRAMLRKKTECYFIFYFIIKQILIFNLNH